MISANPNQKALSTENLRLIFGIVDKFPGLHFRQINSLAEIPVGTLDYSLRKLSKAGLIFEQDVWRYKKYFPMRIPKDDSALIGIIRVESARKILQTLLKKESSHKEMAQSIGLSSSSTHWHLKRLLAEGVIVSGKGSGAIRYHLANNELIRSLLVEYKESVNDKMMNNFISMWE